MNCFAGTIKAEMETTMEIQILQLMEGARQARGLTVIIDVFRAFSLECYLYDRGVSLIYPVGSLEEARGLKEEHPDWLLIGERNGQICEGFDFGNSPSRIPSEAVSGRTVIHTTSAGTKGIASAAQAREILSGSLVNARAVAAYLRLRNPETVTLVCMGNGGVREAKEDVLCAHYIRALLMGEVMDIRREALALRENGGEHFFDPLRQHIYPKDDFELCIDCDRFPFVLKAVRDSGNRTVMQKVELPV